MHIGSLAFTLTIQEIFLLKIYTTLGRDTFSPLIVRRNSLEQALYIIFYLRNSLNKASTLHKLILIDIFQDRASAVPIQVR